MLWYSVISRCGRLPAVATVLSSENEHLYNLTQPLLLHLLLGLQDHVYQFLIVCLTSCHHLQVLKQDIFNIQEVWVCVCMIMHAFLVYLCVCVCVQFCGGCVRNV